MQQFFASSVLLLGVLGCSSAAVTQTSFADAGRDGAAPTNADGAAEPIEDAAVDDAGPFCTAPDIALALADVPVVASEYGKPVLLTKAFARLSPRQGNGLAPLYDVQIFTRENLTCATVAGSAGAEKLVRIKVPRKAGACSPSDFEFAFVEVNGGSTSASLGQSRGRVEISDLRAAAFSMRVNITATGVSPPPPPGSPPPPPSAPSKLQGTFDVTVCP